MGVIKSAISDAILTSIFVFFISTLRILTSKTAFLLNLEPVSLPGLFITTILNTIIILTITLIGRILGGASFNPSSTISFYTLGLRPDSSLLSMSIRFPAQAIGGAIGIKAILHVIPSEYLHMVKGPSLKVDIHTGAIAEGVLSFTHNFVIILVMLRGPKNPWLKVYLLSVTTLVLVVLGSGYTGPSLNPANAFGWAYVNDKHNTLEQFYVFWICPLIGASLAALVYRFAFMSPVKEKKA
ncbi:aquaporin SIP1-2-like [Vicia villosa]|uniref:aquaporin SIP1-2-like n=1 Tax=Vicia villosa TaxID=3911 RepID=UPI00273ACD0C|nr:aquaporin SIP1-2-like [Vicia villosa]